MSWLKEVICGRAGYLLYFVARELVRELRLDPSCFMLTLQCSVQLWAHRVCLLNECQSKEEKCQCVRSRHIPFISLEARNQAGQEKEVLRMGRVYLGH